MRKSFLMLIALVTILACSSLASADPWTEIGDAGALPGTAQTPFGTNPLTSIAGTIGDTTDADMFQIFIPVGAAFSATTVGTAGTLGDTQLHLFNSAGFGVYFNDDASGVTLRSTLPAGHAFSPPAAGIYYIVITAFDLDPVSAGGQIFPDTPFTAVHGPTGPGGSAAITGYTGTNGGTGTYTIVLTGAQFVPNGGAAVPEPATLLLLGTGLAGIAARIRKRRKTLG